MRYHEITEMSPPPEFKGQRFYHGTGSMDAANGILRHGLRGRPTQGRAHLAPVAGRVYMTSDLSYAIMYALNGDLAGHDWPASREGQSIRGYVFVINGSDLQDVEPDEDSIGKWLYDHGEARYEERPSPYRPGTMARVRTGWLCKIDKSDPRYYLWHRVAACFTEKQMNDAMEGTYSAWAAGGKRALKKLSDHDKHILIQDGAHIHHPEGVMPSECWAFDKRRCKELARDGSNFFEIAERIR